MPFDRERRADQAKSESAVIRRYFVGYFGQKPVDAVSEADLERYAEWRRTYWTEGPGKLVTHIEYERGGHRLRRPVRRSAPSLSRQRGELVVLRQLLRWASRQGYLKTSPEPPQVSRRLRLLRGWSPDEANSPVFPLRCASVPCGWCASMRASTARNGRRSVSAR